MASSKRMEQAGRTAIDEEIVQVGRALGGLDPWSFWVIPELHRGEVFLRVVGTTGAFVVGSCDAEGSLRGGRWRVAVGDRAIGGLSKLRRGARRLRRDLNEAVVETPVEPILCLTRAKAGAPRAVRGVWVSTIDRLVPLIADRSNRLPRARAQRGAKALGLVHAREAREEAGE